MVHHFPHEVDVGHEDGGVALAEEEGQPLEAQLELLVFGGAHVLCEKPLAPTVLAAKGLPFWR